MSRQNLENHGKRQKQRISDRHERQGRKTVRCKLDAEDTTLRNIPRRLKIIPRQTTTRTVQKIDPSPQNNANAHEEESATETNGRGRLRTKTRKTYANPTRQTSA